MEQLVITDISYPGEVQVHIYSVDCSQIIDEDYIESLGFCPAYCQWALGDDVSITIHKEPLTG